jgi:hypothetical protein
MSNKVWAILAVVVYWLLMMVTVNAFPKKCYDHTTADERLKTAMRAPFMSLFGTGLSFLLAWAVFTLMFQ